jgi:hypothetical protein
MFTTARIPGGFQRVVLGDAVPPGFRKYQEKVIGRKGAREYTILLRELRGLGNYRGRAGLGRLGASGVSTAGLVSSGAGIATTATISSVASGTALGSWAGPIGAGVGALVGIIAGLWSAHEARAKGATTENQALNSALTAFNSSLQAIFSAANSGQVTGSQAAGVCQQALQSFWTGMAPYTSGPGRADASNGGTNCGTVNPSAPCTGMLNGHYCNSSCTATCCVGCQDLTPTVYMAVQLLNSSTGGSIQTCNVAGSKYGATGSAPFTLTYTPPAPTTAAGAATAASNALSSLSTSTIAGLPAWMVLAAAGLGIFAVTR